MLEGGRTNDYKPFLTTNWKQHSNNLEATDVLQQLELPDAAEAYVHSCMNGFQCHWEWRGLRHVSDGRGAEYVAALKLVRQ